MAEKTRTAFVVLVPVLATILVLGVVEVLLRLFAPIYTVGIQGAYQYDPDLGYRLVPGIHRYEMTDHLEEIRTNALGTVNFQERFDGYSALVFALGDSFTQGTGLPADAAYPFQLDLLLNRDEQGVYRRRYGVVNLGLAAFGTEQELITLRRYAGLLGKPRFVLYLGCDNDWEDDVLLRSGYRHRHLVAGSPTWGPLVVPLTWLSHLELVKRVKLAVSEVRRKRLVTASTAGAGPAGKEPPVAERVWPTIEKIVAQARAWDAVVVLGWANPGTDSYAWLKAKAAEEHIPFADWQPAADSVRQSIPDLPMENPHSGGHWRPWTNTVIAGAYQRAMGLGAAADAPAPK